MRPSEARLSARARWAASTWRLRAVTRLRGFEGGAGLDHSDWREGGDPPHQTSPCAPGLTLAIRCWAWAGPVGRRAKPAAPPGPRLSCSAGPTFRPGFADLAVDHIDLRASPGSNCWRGGSQPRRAPRRRRSPLAIVGEPAKLPGLDALPLANRDPQPHGRRSWPRRSVS